MKKISIKLAGAALVLLCLMQSCAKKETPSIVVEIGYPTITLNGPAFTTIARGSTWSDPGASWTDSVTGESGIIKVAVNTSVDSAYMLVYTATDKHGFSSTVTRGLGVTNNVDTANLSGNYTNQNTGGVDSIQKVAKALYLVPAVDGNPLDPTVFVIKTDGTISMATIIEQGLTAPGANLPEILKGAYLSYSQPYTFGATDSIANVPSFPIQFVHN